MSRIGKITRSTPAGHPRKRPQSEVLPPVLSQPARPATRLSPERSQERSPVSYSQPRPATGFLAQYVDQFSPWTVQPKAAKRQTATEAYGQSDLLIEEMIRWRRQRFDRCF